MTSTRLPPGPRLPAVVQSYLFAKKPLPLFDHCQRQLGDIFTLKLNGANWVLVSSPELVKQVYTAPADVAQAGVAKARLFGPVLGTTSSLVLDGEAHLKRRRLLLPGFHGDKMHAYSAAITRATEEAMARWPLRSAFSIHEQFQKISLNAVLGGIFGDTMSGALKAQLGEFMSGAATSRFLLLPALQKDLGPWSPWGKVLRIVVRTKTAVRQEVRRRRDDRLGDDILAMLLGATDEHSQPLSDDDIVDELLTMVVAGHEITGLSLAWALSTILSNPSVLKGIEDELDEVAPNAELDSATLGRLRYLDGAIKESMRLAPAVASGSIRLLRAPYTIGEYTLPPGTILSVCTHLLHRRPDLYPEPEVFRAERFIDKKVDPYAWVPFGGGIRRCLGMAFALHEIKIVLATMLSRVRLELAQPRVDAVRRGAFVAPSGGPRVIVVGQRQRGSNAKVRAA